MSKETGKNLLEVKDLRVSFPSRHGAGAKRMVHAVNDVSFSLRRGRSLGIVGESGSGKTTTALAVMRLVEPSGGSILFDGVDLTQATGECLRRMRPRFQMIFQDPFSSLEPRKRAGAIVREPMDLLGIGTEAERRQRVDELFARVGLREDQKLNFPHQFSGGQRQRIGIARAIATRPDLVVCDEPVSALDVAIQAQILNLLVEVQEEFGLSYLFISHDLGVVHYVCDEIAVMYLGKIVEHNDRQSLFRQPLHPYTWALLSAVPGRGAAGRQNRIRLKGDPPSPFDLPKGCSFAQRCPFAQDECRNVRPELRPVSGGRVACHRVNDEGVGPHHEFGEAVSRAEA